MFKKTLPSRNSLHWFSVLEKKIKSFHAPLVLNIWANQHWKTPFTDLVRLWIKSFPAPQNAHGVLVKPPAPFTVNGCHIWLQGVYKPDKKRDFLLSPGHSWGNNSRLRQQMADQTRWNRCAGSNCPGQLTLCPNPRC